MSRSLASGSRLHSSAHPAKHPRQVDPVLTQRGVEAFIKLLSTAITLDKQDDLEDQQLGCGVHNNRADWAHPRRSDECGMTLITKMKKFQWLEKQGYITGEQMHKLQHLAELFQPRLKQLTAANQDRKLHAQQQKLHKHHAAQEGHKSAEMLKAYHQQLEQMLAMQLQSANALRQMTPPVTPPHGQRANNNITMHDYFSLVPNSSVHSSARSPVTPLSGPVPANYFPYHSPSTSATTSPPIVDLCAPSAPPAFSFLTPTSPPAAPSFPFSFACALPSPPINSDSSQQSYFDFASLSTTSTPAYTNDPAPGYGYPPPSARGMPNLSLRGESCFGPMPMPQWDMQGVDAMQVDLCGMTPAVEKDGFDFGSYVNIPEDE